MFHVEHSGATHNSLWSNAKTQPKFLVLELARDNPRLVQAKCSTWNIFVKSAESRSFGPDAISGLPRPIWRGCSLKLASKEQGRRRGTQSLVRSELCWL